MQIKFHAVKPDSMSSQPTRLIQIIVQTLLTRALVGVIGSFGHDLGLSTETIESSIAGMRMFFLRLDKKLKKLQIVYYIQKNNNRENIIDEILSVSAIKLLGIPKQDVLSNVSEG